MHTVLAAMLLLAAPQDRKTDDVLQKRDGGLLVGRVTKLDEHTLDILVNGEREPRRLLYRDLMPYSVYKVRLERIDRTSGEARMSLGDFCMTSGLFTQAAKEFEEAAKLDKALEEKAKKRRLEAHHEDARSRFEEAKKLHQKKDQEEAIRILNLLLDPRYEDTPYPAEARQLLAKIAEEVKAEKEALKAQLDADKKNKDAMKAAAAANAESDLVTKTLVMIEDAQKAYVEGLDNEPKNLTKADKAWKEAERLLLTARRNLEPLVKSGDAETVKKAREIDRQINFGLVRAYYRLGRMFAVELNYPNALEYLNKAAKVPHDEAMDKAIHEILTTISQLKMRERAAGRGY